MKGKNIPGCHTPRSQHENTSLWHRSRRKLLLCRGGSLILFLFLVLLLFAVAGIVGLSEEFFHFHILRIHIGLVLLPGVLLGHGFVDCRHDCWTVGMVGFFWFCAAMKIAKVAGRIFLIAHRLPGLYMWSRVFPNRK